MTIAEIQKILNDISFKDYTFRATVDGRGEMYLQGHYVEADTVTKKESIQLTRRWFLSPQATRSEIVQTVFKCALTSMEHRTREWFHYKGRPVYSPHYNVEALWLLAGERENFSERD